MRSRRGYFWRPSTVRLDLDAWEVGESGVIRAQDSAGCSPRGSRNDQVVRPPGRSLASDMDQQLGMGLCDSTVVVEDGDDREDAFKERKAGRSLLPRGEEHADSQFGCSDGGDGDLVVVADSIVEVGCRAFGVDQEGRVTEEPGQGRSSISTTARMAARSFGHWESGRWRRSRDLTSAPCPSFIGSRLAIALPRRTIVKRSPRCSTASRRSAKLRAASVAVISDTLIRVSDPGTSVPTANPGATALPEPAASDSTEGAGFHFATRPLATAKVNVLKRPSHGTRTLSPSQTSYTDGVEDALKDAEDRVKPAVPLVAGPESSSRHGLCWHHPALWGCCQKADRVPVGPERPHFLRGLRRVSAITRRAGAFGGADGRAIPGVRGDGWRQPAW